MAATAKSSYTMEAARVLMLSDKPSDHVAGRAVVERLAEQGNPEALYAKATWMLYGANGYRQDQDEAVSLLSKAAAQLVPAALYDLATYEAQQVGGRQGNRSAFAHFLVSALLGDADALKELRRCFYWGTGVFKNLEAADLLGDIIECRDASH